MIFDDVKKSISKALNEFYENDNVLVNYNASNNSVCERTISARLAIYLQNMFKEYNVDCEYNKHINDIKRLENKNIFPDIVIHKRQNDDSNLLWIELKKSKSKKRFIFNDEERLKTVTMKLPEGFSYQYGALVIISQKLKDCVIKFYENGKLINENDV